MPVLNPKAGHFIVKEAGSGRLLQVTESEADELIARGAGTFAPQKEVDAYNHTEEFGTTGQQALGLAETVARAATFGVVSELEEGGVERQKELALQSPTLQFGAEVVGSLAGGGGVGAGARGAAKALGAGARLAGKAGLLGAEIGEAAADEVNEAYKANDRAFSLKNFGMNAAASGLLGGVISQVGKRVVAPGAAKARRLLDKAPVDGDGVVEDAALRAVVPEQVSQAAQQALDLPVGNARTKELHRNYEAITADGAKSLGTSFPAAFEDAYRVLDRSTGTEGAEKLRKLLPTETPELRTRQTSALIGERDAMDEFLAHAKAAGWDKETSFKGEIKRLNQARDQYAKVLAGTGDVADFMVAARKSKQARQTLNKKLSNKTDAAKFQSGTLEDVKDRLAQTEHSTRNLLESEELFGKAGKWEKESNSIWSEGLEYSPLFDRGIMTHVGSLYDPAPGRGLRNLQLNRGKIQDVLRQDDNQSHLMRKAFEDKAVMLERTAKLNGPDGSGFSTQAEVDQMLAGAADIRRQLKNAQDANVARSTVKNSPDFQVVLQAEDKATTQAAKAATGLEEAVADTQASVLGGIAVDAVGGSFGAGYIGSQLMRVLLKGNQATGAIRESVGTALGLVEKTARESTGRAGFSVGVQSGLGRFQGEHESPQASYEAKRDAIMAAVNDPQEATLAAVESVASLEQADPEAFQQLMGQTHAAMSYIQENAPQAMGTSAEYPNGVPLSSSQLRHMATMYDTVNHPMSVLEDMSSRLATPQQMQVLQDVHPDIHQEIVQSAINQVSADPAAVSPSSKSYLSNILGIGDIFGPLYTPMMSQALEGARAVEQEQPRNQPAPTQDDETSAPTAGGLKSIQTSVTNG